MVDYDGVINALEDMSDGRAQRDIFNGWAYSTGRLFQDITGEVSILIENPSSSGKFVFISTRVATGGRFYTSKVDNVTVDTIGTSLEPQNRKLSDGTSDADVHYNPTTSGGNNWSRKIVGSGGSGATITGAVSPTSELLLEEGDNVLIKAENATASNLDVSIDIDFFEIPLSEVEELQ